MIRGYKYELCPTSEQVQQFSQFFGNVRFVHNWALAKKIEMYEKEKKSISQFELMRQLTELKKDKEFLTLSPSHSLQKSINHVDTAFVNFFKKRTRFPKFKKKSSRQSFEIPDKRHISVNYDKCTVSLPKVGEVRFYRDREIKGEIRKGVVSRSATGRHYISIIVEDGMIPIVQDVDVNGMVGIDLGVKDFAVFSDGTKVSNPKFLDKSLKKLAILQKRKSKKKKGSKNSGQYKNRIARLHEKVANQRKDFQHKVSTSIAKKYSFVAMEDLGIQDMLKNGNLSRRIQDAGWYGFKEKLKYKLSWVGGEVVEIGRFEPSSKLCSSCGNLNRDLKLSDRVWICDGCGIAHDRDVNAAKNIKKFGEIKLGPEVSGSRINKACVRDASRDATV